MERTDFGEATEQQIAYVEYLEKRVEGASILAKEISLLKAGIAHDLQLIRNNEQGDEYEHLKYICLDKLSPKYNLVKVLMTNINAVEDNSAKPARSKKEVDAEEKITMPIAGELDPPELETGVVKPMRNAFEDMSERIAKKRNASG